MTTFDRFGWLLALLLGVVSAFAFQPVGWWPLMPLAFAGLCFLIDRAPTLKRALLSGWLFGLGQFAVGLNWIATAFTFQAAMPAWLGWVAVLLLSLYLAIYPALAAGLAWRFGREKPLALVLALAGAWAVTEWLRATMFTGFAWNPVGVTLTDTPLLGASALLGTYGLSAFVVLASGALWLAWQRKWLPAIAIAAAIWVLSSIPFSRIDYSESSKNVRVVQPNIGQQDKWRPGFSEESARRLASLTGPASEKPRLILWPEAAITEPLQFEGVHMHPGVDEFRRDRATSSLGPNDLLITGGLALTSRDGIDITGATNSVFVLGPGGTLVARYDKAHLVPYGEYLPMRPLLSAIGLSRLAPGDIDFVPGPGPRSVALPGWGKVGFQLCYEIIFSGEVVDRSNRPDFIFNPSNDAWFGAWGPPQHLAQARLRAAEEGLPVIRATPTGISAIVDARGQVLHSLPWRTAGVIDAELPTPAPPTIFARFGNLIPLGLAFLLIAAAIALNARARYRRNI